MRITNIEFFGPSQVDAISVESSCENCCNHHITIAESHLDVAVLTTLLYKEEENL